MYHFIKKKIHNKDLIARYISTYDQSLDVFTKSMTTSCFLLFHHKLMVRPLPVNLRGDVKSMTNGATYVEEEDIAGVLPTRKVKESITQEIWYRQLSKETLHISYGNRCKGKMHLVDKGKDPLLSS